jgi:D-alanyl-lipoteichoic acid acyltransferase DltB (MBOAT superfamily)
MVFNSLTFVLFFAIVLAVYRLPLSWTLRKFHLLAASYLFYAAWNPPFVLLLMISAGVDLFLGRWMGRVQGTIQRRLLLAASLVLNLGLLGYFKYGRFVLDNFAWALQSVGVTWRPSSLAIVLPMGISFYTFETISYLVDVYRGKIKPWSSFLDYALFLTFFPHLVAGPIVRAADFLPQCETPRHVTGRQMGWGLSLLIIGLFEKVILADSLTAPVADKVFSAGGQATFADAWLGTFAFAAQIFFDFAGYSTCAIGIALCFGFVLNDNFHFPYAAVGFSDFWQRWHMSLSSWLRDYLYIPLGGNRKGTLRTDVNLMATMLIGGLWHGAAWRFVAWGGLHGMFLIGERHLRRIGKRDNGPLPWPVQLSLMLLTFGLVCVTWVFFRAHDFSTAFDLLAKMLSPSVDLPSLTRFEIFAVTGTTGALLAGQWLLRSSTLEEFVGRLPWWLCSIILGLALVSLAFASGDERAFIYFQF